MSDDQRRRPFDESTARSALSTAAEKCGVPYRPAVLISPVADNALFRLPDNVVGRVSSTDRTLARAARDVQIGRWLNNKGFPAVAPVEGVVQPVVSQGRVVTFWHEVPDAVMASTRELGSLLHHLHSMAVPPDVDIEPLQPFVRIDAHLEAAAPHLADHDVAFLAQHLAELHIAYDALDFDHPVGLIHGDANRKNAVRGSDGRAVLLDLERFSVGPRQWDLTVSEVYRRLGWYTEAEYDDFVDAYGWDVRGWDGLPILVAIREFRMTAWLASRVGREPALRSEAEKRIASLRAPDARRTWTPGD
ncbi:phosphotransferase family protein [Yinghuangia soli]|uniref:Aminoglycoside phosphotransferase family protein n=1 Tax=Yinghuangia soli TaxID=2908204 RepID=A0AA41Q6L7_9ACTN|nr:aminoglycoside phosphotransferase family protein [Yinghuangia soli]MCF2531147.1 aminoglycoside phosphotransferase family protein [Yinghuangia soli]